MFDATRGYPGEGPESRTSEDPSVVLSTANVTAWSSFINQKEFEKGHAVWCLQETKLWNRTQVRKARAWAAKKGLAAHFSLAVKTPKGGVSGGTAVVWDMQRVHFGASLETGSFPSHRATGVLLKVGGLEVEVWSVYGHVDRQ